MFSDYNDTPVYIANTVTISGDSNLIAKYIRKGISIFGVTGTCEPVSYTITVKHIKCDSSGTAESGGTTSSTQTCINQDSYSIAANSYDGYTLKTTSPQTGTCTGNTTISFYYWKDAVSAWKSASYTECYWTEVGSSEYTSTINGYWYHYRLSGVSLPYIAGSYDYYIKAKLTYGTSGEYSAICYYLLTFSCTGYLSDYSSSISTLESSISGDFSTLAGYAAGVGGSSSSQCVDLVTTLTINGYDSRPSMIYIGTPGTAYDQYKSYSTIASQNLVLYVCKVS